jgi:hypothetical protein
MDITTKRSTETFFENLSEALNNEKNKQLSTNKLFKKGAVMIKSIRVYRVSVFLISKRTPKEKI